MTTIEKVLQRRDAASLIVAIIVGTSVAYLLAGITGPITSKINFSDQFQGGSIPAGDIAVQSLVSFAFQVIALELLLRGVILARAYAYKKGK